MTDVTPIREPAPRPPLAALAIAALVALGRRAGVASSELEVIGARGPELGDDWHAYLAGEPFADDPSLAALTAMLDLTTVEQLAIAILIAVEDDAPIARLVNALQSPAPGSRPMVGMLATAFARAGLGPGTAFDELVGGAAHRAGAIVLRGDDAPLVERRLVLPPAVHAALRGLTTPLPGVTLGAGVTIALPASMHELAARHAAAFGAAERSLVVRTPSLAEGRAVCAAIATAADAEPAFIEGEPPPGLGLWLALRALVPVFVYQLGPNDKRRLPPLPGYHGPILALAGAEGSIDRDGVAVPSWRLGVPARAERTALWQATLDDGALAAQLGAQHRHGVGRIAQLGRAARHVARLDRAPRVERRHIRTAAWTSEGPGLRGLAEPIDDDVPDRALVTTAPLRRDLELLLLRCRQRDDTLDGLGAAMRARYRPGVRALFVGPSGTGKTFAASWLASRLAAPLYRVDLAAVTSKYIGETEKNLAQLLDQAEHEEIILLFDEADSMFGKRTDVKDSNDRFANAQTNFLLQRIESFDGVVILTSNSRNRIDAAFTRRLDAVVDFPPPGPEERRALWLAHLGELHLLDAAAFNRLATACDLAGGHVRNAVLCANLLARHERRPIQLADVVAGLAVEYRKLGRTVPAELGDATQVRMTEDDAP
jgi:hypothetical protein